MSTKLAKQIGLGLQKHQQQIILADGTEAKTDGIGTYKVKGGQGTSGGEGNMDVEMRDANEPPQNQALETQNQTDKAGEPLELGERELISLSPLHEAQDFDFDFDFDKIAPHARETEILALSLSKL